MSELAMKIDPAATPDLEAVGVKFNEEQMLFVRQRTRSAIHEIAARVKPGMVEEDAVEMAKDLLANLGMLKGWHDVYVRFGTNTLKTFGAPSDPGVILGANDVFFIDIGPVWKDWEGDGGDTFVVGQQSDMERCAADARKLFHMAVPWCEVFIADRPGHGEAIAGGAVEFIGAPALCLSRPQ